MEPQKKLAKFAAIVSVAVLVAYFIVTMSFVLPNGALKTSLEPINKISSPYFTQTWNVFAPNIAKTNPSIRFQTQWVDDTGERFKTDWINLTEVEFGSIPGHLLPSRVHKTSWNMLSRYQNRYSKLNDEQKKVVRNTFIKREGNGFAAKSNEELSEELNALGNNKAQVRDFLRYDDMMREYVTYFAQAYFPDEDITRVRWQIFREYPNDYDNRKNKEILKEPTEISLGWRQAFEQVEEGKLQHFEDLIRRYGGEISDESRLRAE